MCLYPKLIKNRKYTVTKKNEGNVPVAEDARVLFVPVACGKCIECCKQKARAWQVRLQEEIRTDKNGQFVTLTFSTESILELLKEIKTNVWYRDWETDRKSTRLNSSHITRSRMPSSA